MNMLKHFAWAFLMLLAFSLQGCHKDENNVNEDQGGEVCVYPDTLRVTVNGVSLNMRHVIGGSFVMGGQNTNPAAPSYDLNAYSWEGPLHKVTVSDFYIAETEVTQALWKAVMENNPSHFVGDDLPVETVSWIDCNQFINALNELSEYHFYLPTEAQWEFAARGGKLNHGYKFSGSNNLDAVAWYSNNADSTHAVATKRPNELGLYDMSGNVMEWCSDYFGAYPETAQEDPAGPETGNERVIRGGSWGNVSNLSRVSFRDYYYGDKSNDNLGFRLAMGMNFSVK